MRKAAEWAGNIFYLILLSAAALLAFPLLPGWSPQVVLSGSMEPEIPVGSLVYIDRRTKAEEIRAGDVIAYHLGEKAAVLHRVIRVEKSEGYFTTKGDANQAEDPGEVSFGQYMGKLVFCIPLAGYLAAAVQHPAIWAAGGAVFLLICGIRGITGKGKKVMSDEKV